MPVLIPVHEVSHHVEAPAVDPLLARLVEVKLHELVPLAFHGDRAARSVIHLDRVAVVDDLQRRRLVVENDGRKVALLCDCVLDVDRRLRLAGAAGLIFMLERGPLRGARRTLIAPMMLLVGVQKAGSHHRGCGSENGNATRSVDHLCALLGCLWRVLWRWRRAARPCVTPPDGCSLLGVQEPCRHTADSGARGRSRTDTLFRRWIFFPLRLSPPALIERRL